MRLAAATSWFALRVLAFTALGLAGGTLPALAADTTPGCGGLNERACATSKATFRGKVRTPQPGGSFFDPREGGEYWSCPSDRPRRTAYAVTDHRACATNHIIGEQLSRAQFRGKVTNPLPSGAFFDPRQGGEYWSCPGGYIRNLNPVTHDAACTIAPQHVCDAGNVAVGQTCVKKGACGQSNGRPCLLVERIPSCDKGLAEDFLVNKCIPESVAGCLTTVRTIKIIMGGGNRGESMKKGNETLAKQVTGFKDADDGAKKKRASGLPGRYQGAAGKAKLESDAAEKMKPFAHLVPELQRIGKQMGTVSTALKQVFTDESTCTASPPELSKKFAALNLKPSFPKKTTLLDGLVGTAHAADEHFFMSYALSAGGGVGIGGAVELSFVTDYRNSHGLYFSIGPMLVTNASGGGSFALGFYPKVASNSFTGWGWSGGISGGPPSKIVSAGANVMFDLEFVFQGFGVNVGIGAGVIPAEATFGASHTWKVVGTK